MKYQMLGDTLALRLEPGEELLAALTKACEQTNITLGTVSGLGAADYAVVGAYSLAEKRFCPVTLERELEITGLAGNVTTKSGAVYLHLHATFADMSGQVWGGHLSEARISATAEIFVRTIPNATIARVPDEITGLNIMDL